jgi:hypothetical protein
LKGFGSVEVGPDRDRLAVPDLGYESQGRLHFDAAGFAAIARAADRDEPVSQVPELRNLDVDFGKVS